MFLNAKKFKFLLFMSYLMLTVSTNISISFASENENTNENEFLKSSPVYQNKEFIEGTRQPVFNEKNVLIPEDIINKLRKISTEIRRDVQELDLWYFKILDRPELFKHMMLLKPEQIKRATLNRALDIKKWLPAAKMLVESGISLEVSYIEDTIGNPLLYMPLHKCVSLIEVYGDYWTYYKAEKEENFSKIDCKIRDNPYFKFAVYLYERGAYRDNIESFKKHLTQHASPLTTLTKDEDCIVTKRVIEFLAPYEADVLNVDVKKYKTFLYRIISEAYSEKKVFNYSTKYNEQLFIGTQFIRENSKVNKIWEEIFSTTSNEK
ncbi:MAG: hypothetical protein ACRYGR_04630 [Janthinobacterium lividum]